MSNLKSSFWLTPKGFAALGLIAVASYFLLMEHRQHVWQYLPYIILLACPFIHLFMHRGHGGDDHDNHGGQNGKVSDRDAYQRGLEEGRKQSTHR